MKLIKNTYKLQTKNVDFEVMTCNKNIVTLQNLNDFATAKIDRKRFEGMINKGIFRL